MSDIYSIKGSIKLIFDSKINYGDFINKASTRKEPKIIFEYDPLKKYTIMMVDPDAPSAKKPDYKYFLHWLTVNNGQIINSYSGPNPPEFSGVHRYYTCIFEQSGFINDKEHSRKNFNVSDYVKRNGLKIVACAKFVSKF